MEKGKRIEAEFLLPEPIVQHIQSFLSRKQAAQTSILSKSWYSAWLTRPNLDFDQRDFGRESGYVFDEQGFWEFVKKTVQRYENLNLKIESLRLWMKGGHYVNNGDQCGYSSAHELIVKAIKMGATDLDFELRYENEAFAFPQEVLGSETLIRLSVTGCKIDLGVDGKVSCSRLKTLNLCRVDMEGGIIRDIISSCPLIEKFSLSECTCLFKDQHFDAVRTTFRSLEWADDGLINLCKFHKLKCLLLGGVDIPTLFFRDLSSNFPCLKDLSIHNCGGCNYKGIKISSRSLECISFKQEDLMLRANFDVPSIRKFDFEGSRLPAFSFKTASMEWESDISIRCYRPSTSWFLKLKKLLINLSQSKISLSLSIKSIVEKSVDFQGLPTTVVENLTMQAPSSVCSTLLECLFQSCRPKFITQYWLPQNNDFLVAFCKRLMQQVNQNSCIPEQNTFGPWDLKEVNAELFEECLGEWQPLPLKTLLDASASPKNKRKFRFQLRWG